MKTFTSFFVAVLLLILHLPLNAASFDCAKASTALEETICADLALNRTDEQLGRSYRDGLKYCESSALKSSFCSEGLDSFKRSHRAWLKARLLVCDASDARCLETLYNDYIKGLQAKTSLSGLFEGAWRSLHDNKPSTLGTEGHLACPSYVYGYRSLYCDFRRGFYFHKLQQVSGFNLFKAGGPHGAVLDFSNETHFGHYNPAFLSWLAEYMIPADKNDSRYSRFAQAIYDRPNVREMARLLYVSHQIMFAQGKALDTFLANYEQVARDYREKLNRREVNISRFYEPFKAVPVIQRDYADRLFKAQAGSLEKGVNAGWELGSDLIWLADYLATTEEYNWHAAISAGAYWVRRSIDGSEAQLFEMLSSALKVYDSGFVQAYSANQTISEQRCNYTATKPIQLTASSNAFRAIAFYSTDTCAESTLHLKIVDYSTLKNIYETRFDMSVIAMHSDLPEGSKLLHWAKQKADDKLAEIVEPNLWPPFKYSSAEPQYSQHEIWNKTHARTDISDEEKWELLYAIEDETFEYTITKSDYQRYSGQSIPVFSYSFGENCSYFAYIPEQEQVIEIGTGCYH